MTRFTNKVKISHLLELPVFRVFLSNWRIYLMIVDRRQLFLLLAQVLPAPVSSQTDDATPLKG
jgi:hypothetical protein